MTRDMMRRAMSMVEIHTVLEKEIAGLKKKSGKCQHGQPQQGHLRTAALLPRARTQAREWSAADLPVGGDSQDSNEGFEEIGATEDMRDSMKRLPATLSRLPRRPGKPKAAAASPRVQASFLDRA